MELLLTVKVENVRKIRKKVNSIVSDVWQIQTFEKVDLAGENFLKLMNIDIPLSLVAISRKNLGQTVSFRVGTFIKKGKVEFYGLE